MSKAKYPFTAQVKTALFTFLVLTSIHAKSEAQTEVQLPHPRGSYLESFINIESWKIPCAPTTGGTGLSIKGVNFKYIQEIKIGNSRCEIVGVSEGEADEQRGIYVWDTLVCSVPASAQIGKVDVTISVKLDEYSDSFTIPSSFYYHNPRETVDCTVAQPQA